MWRGEHLEEKQSAQRPKGETRAASQEAVTEEHCGGL